MILGYVVGGWLVGVFLTWAADETIRFATNRRVVQNPRAGRSRWALVRIPAACLQRRWRRLNGGIWINAGTEIVSAGVFALVWSRPTPWAQTAALTLLCALFILAALVDLRYRLVLNVLIFPAMILTVAVRVGTPGTNLLAVLLGGAFGFAIFEMAAWVRPGGLGAGDVKLATLIGLVFGFPDALWALLVAVLAGGVVTAALLLSRRGHSKTLIPYAPFLSIGALVALFYNPVAAVLQTFVGR